MKLVHSAWVRSGILGLLTLVVALSPAFDAHAATQVQSYDLTINSQVAGPPPSTAPTIDSPTTGTTFEQKQIEVKGTCVTALVVKIYRNNLFAGSAVCGTDGQYTLFIDLVEGQNDLIARQYDTANQASPDSETVTVYYKPPSPTTPPEEQPSAPTTPTPSQTTPQPGATGGWAPSGGDKAPFALLINYEYSLQAIFPGQTFQLPVKFTGGTAPYAVSVDWGDGTSDLFSRSDASNFNADHLYQKAGFHTIKIKVSDSGGQQAYLQFVLIVNGSATEALIDKVLTSNEPRYVAARIVAAIVLVLSWIGAFTAGTAFRFHKWKLVRRKR